MDIFLLSTTSYSHCDLFPIYGSGQGAGNSPGLWCAISSVFFQCLQTTAMWHIFLFPRQNYKRKILHDRFCQ